MTTPTPASERQREAALEQQAESLLASLECLVVRHEMDYKADIEKITAALAATHRQALTQAAQVARNAMLNPTFEWRKYNLACDVIANAIKAMHEE